MSVLTLVSCLPKLSGVLIDRMLRTYITPRHLMTAASGFITCQNSDKCVCVYVRLSVCVTEPY